MVNNKGISGNLVNVEVPVLKLVGLLFVPFYS